MAPIRTFLHAPYRPISLRRKLERNRSMAPESNLGLVFACGISTAQLDEIAELVGEVWPGITTLVGLGAGVSSSEGHVEHEPAVVGLLAKVTKARGVLFDPTTARFTTPDSGSEEGLPSPDHRQVVLGLVQPKNWGEEPTRQLAERWPNWRVMAAGVVADQSAMVISPSGKRAKAAFCGVALEGFGGFALGQAHSHVQLGPSATVSRARGQRIMELDGHSALRFLSTCAAKRGDEPLIVALHTPANAPPNTPAVVRAIHGVDPDQGAVLVSGEINEGDKLAFAARDASTARHSLQRQCRRLASGPGGGMPKFSVLYGCAGRGASLYGTKGVDPKILRQSFPDCPTIGLQSACEMVAYKGYGQLHLFRSLVGLFTSPSLNLSGGASAFWGGFHPT